MRRWHGRDCLTPPRSMPCGGDSTGRKEGVNAGVSDSKRGALNKGEGGGLPKCQKRFREKVKRAFGVKSGTLGGVGRKISGTRKGNLSEKTCPGGVRGRGWAESEKGRSNNER